MTAHGGLKLVTVSAALAAGATYRNTALSLSLLAVAIVAFAAEELMRRRGRRAS